MIRNLLWAALLVTTPTLAGPAASAKDEVSEQLYGGVRASELLAARVVTKNGSSLGKVRNIEIADDGQVRALIAEQPGIGLMPEFVFRLPWEHVIQPLGGPVITADLSDTRSREFSLFGHAQGDQRQPDFLVSQVLGDYARLQTGMGYGYVNDVVFSKNGRMIAVLVAKDTAGGGTYAFSYPGRTGRWNPSMSYYGLPFVTSDQADAAGRKVKFTEFEASK